MWFTQRQVRLCWCWCENVGRVFVASAAATCSVTSVLSKGDNRSRGGSVFNVVASLAPKSPGEGGGSNLIFGEAYCTAHRTDTSASVACTVDWNTDRELRKLST